MKSAIPIKLPKRIIHGKHVSAEWANDIRESLDRLSKIMGPSQRSRIGLEQYIPPFYLEPISEFVLRVHPGKLILTLHEHTINNDSGNSQYLLGISRSATTKNGEPQQIIPKVVSDSLTVYRDLAIPETAPGHPCLTWETTTTYGATTYVASSAEVEFLSTMTWENPPDYDAGPTVVKHIFQLGTYTADAGNTGAISSQLRGNVFYTHSKIWNTPYVP
jgi:hypothetical protein